MSKGSIMKTTKTIGKEELVALKESIIHWEKNALGMNDGIYNDKCALCEHHRLFDGLRDCKNCVVGSCGVGSVYIKANNSYDSGVHTNIRTGKTDQALMCDGSKEALENALQLPAVTIEGIKTAVERANNQEGDL